jgi:hypothetical protein
MSIEFLEPEGLARSNHNSNCIQAGNLLFIGGQVSVDPDGQVVGKGDIRAQAQQVYDNITKVLEVGQCEGRPDWCVLIPTTGTSRTLQGRHAPRTHPRGPDELSGPPPSLLSCSRRREPGRSRLAD